MTITICESTNGHVTMLCKDKRFIESWGDSIRIPKNILFEQMSIIAAWCNNDLDVECLFEVE